MDDKKLNEMAGKLMALCHHEWIVTVDKTNFPQDIMCSKCKEVVILVEKE